MSAAKRKKLGRPALPAGERKGAIFSVRLSPEERAEVENAASARGLTSSKWARAVLLEAARRPLPLPPTAP